MTPFQVYLLMQADSICFITALVAVFSGIAFAVSTVARYAMQSCVTSQDTEDKTSNWRDWQAAIKMHRWAIGVFFPSLFLNILMPNTKTIATMVVLPKITSPAALNAMGEKGQQLYDLSTKALGQVVDKNKPQDSKAP